MKKIMQQKLDLAILGIRISTVIYYLIIVGCIIGGFSLPSDSEDFLPLGLWLLASITLAFVIFLEIVIVYLKRRSYWAWVAGIIVGGLFAPSLFLPLGVMILVGLLALDSRMAFGVGMMQSLEPASAGEVPNHTASEMFGQLMTQKNNNFVRLLDHLAVGLRKDGYECEKSLSLGLVTTDLYAYRHVRWLLLPYEIHLYIFTDASVPPLDHSDVTRIQALASKYTNTVKCPDHRWLRFRVPVTISIIMSAHGFTVDATRFVSKHPVRSRVGDINSLSLVDIAAQKGFTYKGIQAYFVLPLFMVMRESIKIIQQILRGATLDLGQSQRD